MNSLTVVERVPQEFQLEDILSAALRGACSEMPWLDEQSDHEASCLCLTMMTMHNSGMNRRGLFPGCGFEDKI